MFVSSLTFNYTTVAVSVTFFFDITTKAFKLCYCVLLLGGIIKRKFNSNKGTKTAIDNNMNVCLTTAQSCRYYSMQYEKFILTVTINGSVPTSHKAPFQSAVTSRSWLTIGALTCAISGTFIDGDKNVNFTNRKFKKRNACYHASQSSMTRRWHCGKMSSHTRNVRENFARKPMGMNIFPWYHYNDDIAAFLKFLLSVFISRG